MVLGPTAFMICRSFRGSPCRPVFISPPRRAGSQKAGTQAVPGLHLMPRSSAGASRSSAPKRGPLNLSSDAGHAVVNYRCTAYIYLHEQDGIMGRAPTAYSLSEQQRLEASSSTSR